MTQTRCDSGKSNEAVLDGLSSEAHPQPDRRRAWALWLRRVFVVVIAGFVGLTLYALGRDFRASELTLRAWPILAVTLVLTFANFAQAMAWVRLLDRLTHARVPRAKVCAIYCAGQLARYTPGKVALVVVRVAGMKRLGLDARLVASSVGIEVISWMTMGMLLGSFSLVLSGASLPGHGALISRYSFALGCAVVAGILVLLLVDRRRFPAFVLRAIRAEGSGPILSLAVVGWQGLSWLGCVAQALLLPYAVGADLGDAWGSVGLFILAPIAGFLAMVAPGGLGVREAVLSASLSPSLGASRALAVALLARGLYVVSEVIAYFAAKWLVRKTESTHG